MQRPKRHRVPFKFKTKPVQRVRRKIRISRNRSKPLVKKNATTPAEFGASNQTSAVTGENEEKKIDEATLGKEPLKYEEHQDSGSGSAGGPDEGSKIDQATLSNVTSGIESGSSSNQTVSVGQIEKSTIDEAMQNSSSATTNQTTSEAGAIEAGKIDEATLG